MLKIFNEYKTIVSSLIKLALPILGGNLAQLMLGITDTAVAGHYSTVALGAISVANAIIASTTVGAIGLILGVSVVISNLRGQGKPTKELFKSTILFSLLVCLPFFLLLELFLLNIDFIKLSSDIVEPVKEYIAICAWSLFPMAIFVALKEFLQAYEKVIFTNFVMILTVFFNLFFDIALTFGMNIGIINIPALGVIGLSIATLLSRIFSCLVLLLYCISLFKTKFVYSKSYLKELFRVGAPISASIFFEFLGFNIVAVLIGRFSAVFAGVHNIIICIANFSFMIILSISNAASVKISYFKGKNDILSIFKYAYSNIALVLCVCLVMFIILTTNCSGIVSLFSNDLEVLYLAKKILIIAICFLFFDGIQGACVGILKGLKDTKVIMFATFIGYLFVGLPLGCYLAYFKNIVLEGFWIGLAFAIAVLAIITATKAFINLRRLKTNYFLNNP